MPAQHDTVLLDMQAPLVCDEAPLKGVSHDGAKCSKNFSVKVC